MRRYILIISLTVLYAISSIFLIYKIKQKDVYYNSIIQAEKSKYTGFLIKDKNNLDILLMNGDDIINHHVLSDKQWEPHVQNVLSQILKPKDKVLVLGGHIGIHATLISKLIGKDGKVFIFEPNPKILKFLRTNLFLNNAENVTLYPKAAFSSNTNVAFIAKALGNVGGAHIITSEEDKNENLEQLITVEAVSIDSINEIRTIDVLQMDIEGAEENAVYGAQKLIDRSPNLIVFQEWSPFWMKDIDTYLKFWRSRNYKIVQITLSGGLKELTDEALKSSGQIDIVMTRNLEKLINNFKPL